MEGGVLELFAGPLRRHPELAVFLTIGIGYWVGRLGFRGFTLGAVAGVLLAGVAVGQLGVTVSGASLAAVQEVAKSRMPSLGYGVGCAIGNVLLALWGSVVVGLMAS